MLLTRKQFISGLAVAGLTVGHGASLAQAGPKTILISTLTGETTPEGVAMKGFIQEVESKSNGALKVEYLPSSGAGKLNDKKGSMYPALLEERVNIVIGNTTQVVDVLGIKEFELWDMPFLFANTAEADAILDGKVGRMVLDKMEAKGIHGLMYMENGFRNIANAVRPINRPEDMKGLKIRVINNPVFLKTFKALGAEPVGAPFDAVYGMLKDGKINTAEAPYGSILDKKWFEVTKYLTQIDYVYSPYVVSSSAKWWATLTPAHQKVVTEALQRMRAVQRAESRRLSQDAAQILAARGMVVNKVSAINRKAFQNRLAKISSEIVSDVGMETWSAVFSEINRIHNRK